MSGGLGKWLAEYGLKRLRNLAKLRLGSLAACLKRWLADALQISGVSRSIPLVPGVYWQEQAAAGN
jgi:hypothetical protein